MRICLINPPIYMMQEPIQIYYPTGLLYLASYLREHGHLVTVIDAPAQGFSYKERQSSGLWYMGLTSRQIIDTVASFEPNIVGITIIFSINASVSYHLALNIKKAMNVPIVFGGPHASVKPDECLKYADYVIAQEGEASMLKLVETLEAGEEHERLTVSKPIPDLDALPFPARDMIPMNTYFSSVRLSMIHGIKGMNRWATVITSRGCPYDCSFCAIHRTMGRGWRGRSPSNVVSEIDSLVKTYGVTDIVIEDDNATLKPDRMREICVEIVNRNYGLNFYVPNGIRADTLDDDLLLKMNQAGFKEIWIAPESGSQRVVDDVIGKKQSLRKVEEVVKQGTKIGMKVSCFFVVGNPGETLNEMYETINFARKLKRLGMHRYHWGYATPYWGTRLYEDCVKNGYLIEGFDNNSITPSFPSIITPDWSLLDLLEVKNKFRI